MINKIINIPSFFLFGSFSFFAFLSGPIIARGVLDCSVQRGLKTTSALYRPSFRGGQQSQEPLSFGQNSFLLGGNQPISPILQALTAAKPRAQGRG